MKRKGINFLPDKARLQSAHLKETKKTGVVIFLGVIVFFLLFAGVLGYNLYLFEESREIDSQLLVVRQRLEDYEETELQAFLLHKRVKEIEIILKEKGDFGQKWWQTISLLPFGSKIQSAEFDHEKAEIIFSVSTYQEAGNFVDDFPKQKVTEFGGKEVSLPSIKKSETGGYLVDLKINF